MWPTQRAGAFALLTLRLAGRQDRVNLIYKDDSWLHAACHCKQRSHHLLPLADPLAGERGCTDVEEGGLDVAGNGFANQRLASPGGAEQEQPLGGSPGTLRTVTPC